MAPVTDGCRVIAETERSRGARATIRADASGLRMLIEREINYGLDWSR